MIELQDSVKQLLNKELPEDIQAKARVYGDILIAECDTSNMEVGDVVQVTRDEVKEEFEVLEIIPTEDPENGKVKLRPFRNISDEVLDVAKQISEGKAPKVIGTRNKATGEVPYLNMGTPSSPNYVPLNRKNRRHLSASKKQSISRSKRKKRRSTPCQNKKNSQP